MNRSAIYAALLAQLEALKADPYNVLTVSQGFVVWDDAQRQPAVYLVPVREQAEYQLGLPTKWLVHLELYVYVRASTAELGVQVLSTLLDGVELLLSPVGPNGQPIQANTLGGLVSYCAIQGETTISGGYLNQQQSVAVVPLEILTA